MLLFKWDGSDIGDISDSIIWNNNEFLILADRSYVGVSSYTNMVSIICDELKPLFGINKVGRHLCSYRGEKVIIHRILDDTNIEEFLGKCPIEEIQDAFTCRWLLGIVRCNKKTVLIRTYKSGLTRAIPFMEGKIDYERDLSLPKIVLNKWYGKENSDLTFEKSCCRLVSKYNAYNLREEIIKIVLRLDKNYLVWVSKICSRAYPYLKA
jgi:hypothetical protein